MNRTVFLNGLVFLILFLLSCQQQTAETSIVAKPPSDDRDMFGLQMERGLTLNKEVLTAGYLLFCVPNSALTYLMDRNGQIVHQWKGNYAVFNAYLQEDGSLVLGANDPDYPVFDDTGPYGRIQKINWEGKMLWDFEYATRQHIVHHDIAVMPNGNILAIAYEVMPYEEAIAKGRNPEMVPKDGPWLEKIIEIKPDGKYTGEIVWEWHLWDHLIQDIDKSKSNFGAISLHPELMNFNLGHHLPPEISQDSLDVLIAEGKHHRNTTPGNRRAGIFHFNAINYHPTLDQIALSSPTINEIIIIDHSTTTAEAASHRGGNSKRGGDILYRWGNPKNYDRGDSTDQKLFFQHDVRWVETGKPGAGNLTIYNNDIPGAPDSLNYSAIYEITPPLRPDGSYTLEEGKPYGPDKVHWIYVASDTVSFYSSFISGAHRMKNGNTLINEGARGRAFEVTPNGKIVWEFLNPFRGDIRLPNGDPYPLMPMVYSMFRSTFIPADHPGLKDKELKPIDHQPETFKLPHASAE
jgi:hypothetical protein